jgi:2-desacetyl-2-hydroxyethyl bacteriochlorophyllide A dehydrogenase
MKFKVCVLEALMNACVLVAPRKIEVKDWIDPEPGKGEVLLRITLAGICGTDYSVYSGKFDVPLPVVPGHEGVGVVEKLGPGVSDLTPGQRVVIQPNFPCMDCTLCHSGLGNICGEKVRLGIDTDGIFAEYARVPADYVWPVPDDLGDRIAVFTEPLAVAAHGIKIMPPAEGDQVLVIGVGVIGLLTLQLAALDGVETTASDLLDERLAVARSIGADHAVRADKGKGLEPSSFNLIYETSGAPSALAEAIELVAPGGRIALLGLPADEHPVSTTQIVRKELTIVGSMIYTDEFPQVIELLGSGRIDTEPLISDVIGLDDVDNAIRTFNSPDRIKALISI